MRDLNQIIEDVKKASADITAKQKAKDAAEKAYTVSAKALDEAHQTGADLRLELNDALGVLVPNSVQGRVRTSV